MLSNQLRPFERRVLGWASAGVDDEIASRFKRSPARVAQVRRLSGVERPAAAPRSDTMGSAHSNARCCGGASTASTITRWELVPKPEPQAPRRHGSRDRFARPLAYRNNPPGRG